MIITKEEFEKAEAEVYAIFDELTIIEDELKRLQNHRLLVWFTLGKQGRLINKGLRLLYKSQKILDKFSE